MRLGRVSSVLGMVLCPTVCAPIPELLAHRTPGCSVLLTYSGVGWLTAGADSWHYIVVLWRESAVHFTKHPANDGIIRPGSHHICRCDFLSPACCCCSIIIIIIYLLSLRNLLWSSAWLCYIVSFNYLRTFCIDLIFNTSGAHLGESLDESVLLL